MTPDPNTFKAILSNSAGEIARLEATTIQRLHVYIGDAILTGEWVLAPGDTLQIIEIDEE